MIALERLFPNLARSGYRLCSPPDPSYNCIAWAAGQSGPPWWWPDPLGVNWWPKGVPRVVTLGAFTAAYGTLGYQPCGLQSALIAGIEKIAIYTQQAIPTHAARQLPTGLWTSKIGQSVDIEHSLLALDGGLYGNVAVILQR